MSLLWFPVDTRQALSEQGQEQLMMQASASEFLGNTTHSVGPGCNLPLRHLSQVSWLHLYGV